jgi:hypothetical protein
MESPHSCIFKTYATIASFYSSVNTIGGPIFLLLVLPHRWLESEVTCLPQNLLAPHKKVMPLSTTSMATFNDSLDHMPLGFVAGTIFVFTNLFIMFNII